MELACTLLRPANLHVAPRDFHSFDRWRCHTESTAPQHLTPLWTHLLALPLSHVCPLTNWLPVFHLHRQTPQTLRANLKEIFGGRLRVPHGANSLGVVRPPRDGLINATKMKRVESGCLRGGVRRRDVVATWRGDARLQMTGPCWTPRRGTVPVPRVAKWAAGNQAASQSWSLDPDTLLFSSVG